MSRTIMTSSPFQDLWFPAAPVARAEVGELPAAEARVDERAGDLRREVAGGDDSSEGLRGVGRPHPRLVPGAVDSADYLVGWPCAAHHSPAGGRCAPAHGDHRRQGPTQGHLLL